MKNKCFFLISTKHDFQYSDIGAVSDIVEEMTRNLSSKN